MTKEMTESLALNEHAARRRSLTALVLGAPLLASGCASRGGTQEEAEPPIEFPAEWFTDFGDVNPGAALPVITQRLLEFSQARVRRKADAGAFPGPFAVVCKDSVKLGELIADDLRARGLAVAAAGQEAATTLTFDIAIVLNGRFGVLPPLSFGALYEAARLEGMQKSARAWVTANAFGGQPGVAASRIVIGELAGRLLGLAAPLRLASGVGDLLSASGRRARSNYLAYGDARERCIALCDKRPWFWHSTGAVANLKAPGNERTAIVWANPAAKSVDCAAAFELAYGLLVRDGLGLGTERWLDQLQGRSAREATSAPESS